MCPQRVIHWLSGPIVGSGYPCMELATANLSKRKNNIFVNVSKEIIVPAEGHTLVAGPHCGLRLSVHGTSHGQFAQKKEQTFCHLIKRDQVARRGQTRPRKDFDNGGREEDWCWNQLLQ